MCVSVLGPEGYCRVIAALKLKLWHIFCTEAQCLLRLKAVTFPSTAVEGVGKEWFVILGNTLNCFLVIDDKINTTFMSVCSIRARSQHPFGIKHQD